MRPPRTFVPALVILLAAVFATASWATGGQEKSGAAPSSTSPITLTLFTLSTRPFTDPVAKEITARTGVTLQLWDSANRNDKYPLMLASGDLPDMIVMFQGSDILNNYINSKALLPLNTLIDKVAPNLKKYYGPFLKRAVSPDKNNYYIPTESGKTSDPDMGVVVRQDFLEEIVGQRAINGDSFTTDEFKTILKTFAERHPNVKGVKSIPISAEPGAIPAVLEGFWGMMPYYMQGDRLSYRWRHPKYVDMLVYANELYRNRSLDVDWPTMKYEQSQSLWSRGNVFSALGSWYQYEAANTALRAEYGKDTKAQYYLYQLTAPGLTLDQVTTDPRNFQGSLAVGVTSKNKDPERTMKFLDFLGSPEGHYLTFWGVEGVSWDKVNGKMVPRQSVIDDYMKDFPSAAAKYGVRNWGTFMWNLDMMVDNVPMDMLFLGSPTPAAKFAWKTSVLTKHDSAFYVGLQPTPTQPEMISYQKINDITARAIPLIINAASEAEARALFAQMVKDCEDAGATKVEAVINANAAARRELWK